MLRIKTNDIAPTRRTSSAAVKLKEACEYLGGISPASMHRLIHRGLIRPNRSMRHLLFAVDELDRFLRAGQG
jgi:hypothetical protein